MYKDKDRKTIPLFEELFPFGGSLDENNRWLRIAELIPWDDLESSYRSYFSDIGRPATDARLFIGLILLKHMTGFSDREVVRSIQENIYHQVFCGFEHFVIGKSLDPSSMTKLRKRLGLKYFKELEEKTYGVLLDRKIIKGKGLLVDATVFPENIKYPNDVGLLNDVREWLVDTIKPLGKRIGKTYRTYCRKAKKTYLSFSKKKRRTKKIIRRAKREMLQYVRRNLKQLAEIIHTLKGLGHEISRKLVEKLKVGRRIYDQQYEMYKEKKQKIEKRIVSFHRSYVRPIKRGKGGGKNTEFGPKGALSYVDGFLFLDKLDHDNYSEAGKDIVQDQIENYKKKFGKLPPSFTGDNLYGTRKNRKLMDELEIRSAFKPLGRRGKSPPDRWLKKKQKERNRIEGSFGHGKVHFGLDCVKYDGKDGSEMWIRLGIMGMNLQTALVRM
ncbi:MAG: IS5 family transposase [Candidatus Marinimicrobia bacterium]|nr:IS5 family transposase [Candidatus Neomarinimicrobiota bacterium]